MPLSIAFFGTPDFSVPTLKKLVENKSFHVKVVVTQPDKPAGRGQKISFSPVKQFASANNIPVLQPTSIKKEGQAFLDQFLAHGPFDIGVVIAFGQILPVSLLELPKAGCVNIHGSLLPRWRGAAPMQRAIMSGDRETGICLMKMEAGLDTGPVYISQKAEIAENDTFETLHDRLSEIGASLLVQNLEAIAAGRLQAEKQPEEGVTYASKILPEETLIDWSKDARSLSWIIRGMSPFPGAFTKLNGQRLKIFYAKAVQEQTNCQKCPVGTVVSVTKEYLDVQCGAGLLRLEDVQLEGKKRMKICDFLRGYPVSSGIVLK